MAASDFAKALNPLNLMQQAQSLEMNRMRMEQMKFQQEQLEKQKATMADNQAFFEQNKSSPWFKYATGGLDINTMAGSMQARVNFDFYSKVPDVKNTFISQAKAKGLDQNFIDSNIKTFDNLLKTDTEAARRQAISMAAAFTPEREFARAQRKKKLGDIEAQENEDALVTLMSHAIADQNPNLIPQIDNMIKHLNIPLSGQTLDTYLKLGSAMQRDNVSALSSLISNYNTSGSPEVLDAINSQASIIGANNLPANVASSVAKLNKNHQEAMRVRAEVRMESMDVNERFRFIQSFEKTAKTKEDFELVKSLRSINEKQSLAEGQAAADQNTAYKILKEHSSRGKLDFIGLGSDSFADKIAQELDPLTISKEAGKQGIKMTFNVAKAIAEANRDRMRTDQQDTNTKAINRQAGLKNPSSLVEGGSKYTPSETLGIILDGMNINKGNLVDIEIPGTNIKTLALVSNDKSTISYIRLNDEGDPVFDVYDMSPPGATDTHKPLSKKATVPIGKMLTNRVYTPEFKSDPSGYVMGKVSPMIEFIVDNVVEKKTLRAAGQETRYVFVDPKNPNRNLRDDPTTAERAELWNEMSMVLKSAFPGNKAYNVPENYSATLGQVGRSMRTLSEEEAIRLYEKIAPLFTKAMLINSGKEGVQSGDVGYTEVPTLR